MIERRKVNYKAQAQVQTKTQAQGQTKTQAQGQTQAQAIAISYLEETRADARQSWITTPTKTTRAACNKECTTYYVHCIPFDTIFVFSVSTEGKST